MQAIKFFTTFALAFFIAVAATWLVRRAALFARALDMPTVERKIHRQSVALWGGCAVFIALWSAMAFVYFQGWIRDGRVPIELVAALFTAGLLLIIGGMIDDRVSLSWWKQLAFPLSAVFVLMMSGLEVPFVSNPFGPGVVRLDDWRATITVFGSSWRVAPAAGIFLIVWLLGMTYTTKLLDGVDGLASSVVSIAAFVIFVVSLSWDRSGSVTSYLSIALAGATVGFLVWNWHPAKIFLGEGGSTLLGFMLGVLAVISGGKIATALLVMGVPILDVAWIIIRRLRSGAHLYAGDAGHLHFRLLRAGFSQRQIVVLLSLLSLSFGSIAFFFSTKGKVAALAALIVVMAVLGYSLARYEKNSRS